MRSRAAPEPSIERRSPAANLGSARRMNRGNAGVESRMRASSHALDGKRTDNANSDAAASRTSVNGGFRAPEGSRRSNSTPTT